MKVPTGSMHIVGVGGGKGLAALLGGLRRFAGPRRGGAAGAVDLTAVVSVADDGGSSGRLREELGIPAVGDLRNCIVALSRGDGLWRDLFQHRFEDSPELGGHSLGNLVMAALSQSSGGLLPAIERLARPLRLRGRVLPVTEMPVQLYAEHQDGLVVRGESRIPVGGKRISRVWLTPRHVAPAPGVVDALAAADAIVLGPGSLFTSVLPNLLVDGVAEAIRASRALRIFVCNLMTQPGETEGFSPLDHVRTLEEYLGPRAIDVCLVNRRSPGPDLLDRYAAAGAELVAHDTKPLAAAGVLPVLADLLADDPFAVRHDEARLAEMVLSVARCLRRQGLGDEPPIEIHPLREVAMAGGAQ